MAGPFEDSSFENLVPADKRLSAAWLRSLTARGAPTENRGGDLDTIGMPCGGIGCGQLYLGGDGRLWLWDIFNQPPPPEASDYRGPHYAHPLRPDACRPIRQGFALETRVAGVSRVRSLDRQGFSDIRFRGQYPVGHVEYRDAECPVEVSLEAYSPFSPLDVDDSSLPATVMAYTVRNPGSHSVEVGVAGWLENAVCLGSGTSGRGERINEVRREGEVVSVDCRVRPAAPGPVRERRPDLVLDDFERASHERWTATGTAFGSGPVEMEKMPEYQGKVGGQGKRVVNSHAAAPASDVAGRDAAQGTLTSEPFLVDRDYLNFLIGGGGHRGRTCLDLIVDGATVLSITGSNDNRMRRVSWDLRPWVGRTARLRLVDAESGGWGHIALDDVILSDAPAVAAVPLEQEEDYGTQTLALLGVRRGAEAFAALSLDGEPEKAVFLVPGWGDLARRGVGEGSGPRPTTERAAGFPGTLVGAVGRRFRLRPGRSVTVVFVVAWHFAAVRRGSLAHVTDIAQLRRAYAARFRTSRDVVRYLASNFERLSGATRLWRRTWYEDSTLPHWFLERTLVNTSTLATATCLQFDNGRFYGWEGTYCCAGTCQHVWQYAHSVGRVFPALERSVREFVDFGLAFHAETGAVDYRAEAHRVVAVDGLAGTILRVYREHLMSADDRFLSRLWPRVRKAVGHLIARDPNGDGILDGEQYNTLDASWWGEIAWLSSMYGAALRAGAAMALERGDRAFAEQCTALADRGRDAMAKRLFNGEYFVHRIDPAHPEAINTNDGCHIDQMLGQSWAMQVGLDRVLPEAECQRALKALWRFNVSPDVGVYRDRFRVLRGGRWYAMPGEGGLLMCTWPRGGAETASGKGDPTFVGYFNECMSGFEYQVAAHMVSEGMVQEGLAVARLVHDRYAASKRNPFNEVECSSHYARAMASHGVYVAACGFRYHGPKGVLGFVPRLATPDGFACAFIAAEGWGLFRQEVGAEGAAFRVEVRKGRLRLTRLEFGLAGGGAGSPGGWKVWVGRRPSPAACRITNGLLVVELAEPVHLSEGETLRVESPA